jgi:hypothetical protein
MTEGNKEYDERNRPRSGMRPELNPRLHRHEAHAMISILCLLLA